MQGILDSGGFSTETVQALEMDNGAKVAILIKFLPATIQRDGQLAAN